MATTQPYTLQTIQDMIHTIVEGDPDTPATSDDDWSARLNLINNAILTYEAERDTNWDELWITEDAGGTVTAGTTSYSLAPTAGNFKELGGFVRFVDGDVVSKLPVMSPEDAQLYELSEKFCYVTGNPNTGYTLNLNFTPATGDGYTGRTIKYDYYKYANTLSATTDKPELTDPNYIVYKVAAQLFAQRRNFNQYTVYETMAQNALAQMKLANASVANWQYNQIEDTDAGFGV